MTRRVLVSAGEPSGDQHAAAVVRRLRHRLPEVEIEGFGGPALAAAGATIHDPMERYTAMGFREVLGGIVPHLRLLARYRRALQSSRYHLVLAVDYPGFNLRLGRAARRLGVPVLYYIAPQLWAWRPGRAAGLREAADTLAVVLPFEESFFASLGVQAQFVGHPLRDRRWPEREVARAALGIGPDRRVLALFPGSRAQEVTRIWPGFLEAARRLVGQGACHEVLVAATGAGRYPGGESFRVMAGQSDLLLAAADAALVKSGTTTLEAACTGTPMVVSYSVHPLTAAIARRVMTTRRVSLVNLVAGRALVPELLQEGARPEALADTLVPLLDPASAEARRQRDGLSAVRDALGGPGAAERVADLAARLLAA